MCLKSSILNAHFVIWMRLTRWLVRLGGIEFPIYKWSAIISATWTQVRLQCDSFCVKIMLIAKVNFFQLSRSATYAICERRRNAKLRRINFWHNHLQVWWSAVCARASRVQWPTCSRELLFLRTLCIRHLANNLIWSTSNASALLTTRCAHHVDAGIESLRIVHCWWAE